MTKKTGVLGYNFENDRYGILNMDLWVEEGLHCGECFEAYINNSWVADRIELEKGIWYLVNSKLRGSELEGVKIRY